MVITKTRTYVMAGQLAGDYIGQSPIRNGRDRGKKDCIMARKWTDEEIVEKDLKNLSKIFIEYI